MMRHFARSATEPRKWYPLWAFHFDGAIAEIDSRATTASSGDPAVFDLTYRAIEQYAWTGDRQWVDDPDLWAITTVRSRSSSPLMTTTVTGSPKARGAATSSPAPPLTTSMPMRR